MTLALGTEKCRGSVLSLADCFALALARRVGGTLLTTDSQLGRTKGIGVKYFQIERELALNRGEKIMPLGYARCPMPEQWCYCGSKMTEIQVCKYQCKNCGMLWDCEDVLGLPL